MIRQSYFIKQASQKIILYNNIMINNKERTSFIQEWTNQNNHHSQQFTNDPHSYNVSPSSNRYLFENKEQRQGNLAHSPSSDSPIIWMTQNSSIFRNQPKRNVHCKIFSELKKETLSIFVGSPAEQLRAGTNKRNQRLSEQPINFKTLNTLKNDKLFQQNSKNKRQSDEQRSVNFTTINQKPKSREQTCKSQVLNKSPLFIKDLQFKKTKARQTYLQPPKIQEIHSLDTSILSKLNFIKKKEKPICSQLARKKSANHAMKEIQRTHRNPLTPNYKSYQQIESQRDLFCLDTDSTQQLNDFQGRGLFQVLLKKNAPNANFFAKKNQSTFQSLSEPMSPSQFTQQPIAFTPKRQPKKSVQSIKNIVLDRPSIVGKSTTAQQKSAEQNKSNTNTMLHLFTEKSITGNELIKQVNPFPFLQHTSLQNNKNNSTISSTKTTKESMSCSRRKISISDFQVFPDRLGKGSFGDAFMALERHTNFLCVLKIVSKKKMKEHPNQEQFIMREIKMQLYLTHPNLTEMYGFFADSQNVYLIMEVLKDSSLHQKRDKRRLPQPTVAGIVYQVAEGLKYMHEHDVMHRDIKPQNLLMHEDVVKIGDFGCAMVGNLGLRKTVTGCILYCSPQQLKEAGHDKMIDIWSLGVLTYELLFATPPFAKEIIEFMHNKRPQQHSHAVNNLTFPQQVQLQSHTKDFILKILKEKPEDRADILTILNHPFLSHAKADMNEKRHREARKKDKELLNESKDWTSNGHHPPMRLSAPLSPRGEERTQAEVVSSLGRLSSGLANREKPPSP